MELTPSALVATGPTQASPTVRRRLSIVLSDSSNIDSPSFGDALETPNALFYTPAPASPEVCGILEVVLLYKNTVAHNLCCQQVFSRAAKRDPKAKLEAADAKIDELEKVGIYPRIEVYHISHVLQVKDNIVLWQAKDAKIQLLTAKLNAAKATIEEMNADAQKAEQVCYSLLDASQIVTADAIHMLTGCGRLRQQGRRWRLWASATLRSATSTLTCSASSASWTPAAGT